MIGTIFYPLSRILTAIGLFFSTIFAGGGLAAATGTAPPSLKPLPYPAWVHRHWVWENDGTVESAEEFVQGFTDAGIPVGVLNIDRPWATDVGDFTPNADYADMQGLIDWCHGRDMKITLWTTCMINEGAANFPAAKENGYLLSKGKTLKWWAGTGGMLDYSNPQAVRWWEGEMDRMLDLGIDGWKLDGADPYVLLLAPAYGKSGLMGWKQYQKLQYGHFYNYTKAKTGGKGVVWTRPTDDVIGWGLPLTFASREINFVGWVGDQDNDWGGLRSALNQMFTSALFNYVCYGSDIGGFRSGPADNPKDVFTRWAQLGAFCPIMENGGGGEHRPWMYDAETAAIYKDFVLLHYRLIPYIQSQVAYSYERRQPTMRPTFGYYQYLLGDDIFVAPMVSEGNSRSIIFPAGEWIYLFDESKTYSGVKKLNFPMEEFPAFIRKGAILPMGPESLDDAADFTTVMVYPEKGTKSFGLYEDGRPGSTLSYTQAGGSLTLTATATQRPLLWRVYGAGEPRSVTLGGAALAKADSLAQLKALPSGYCVEDGALWVAVRDAAAGAELVVK